MKWSAHMSYGELADSWVQVSRHLRNHLYTVFIPLKRRLLLQISHLKVVRHARKQQYIISQSKTFNLLGLNHSHSTCLANKSDRGVIPILNGEELRKMRAWKIKLENKHFEMMGNLKNHIECLLKETKNLSQPKVV